MVPVPLGSVLENLLGKQRLSPQGNQSLRIEILGVKDPEPHSIRSTFLEEYCFCFGQADLKGLQLGIKGSSIVFHMKQTDYFRRRVLQQRPYIKLEWCEKAVRQPEHIEVQPDGRIRHWLFVPQLGKHLRVITLEDGQTLHNAFPDRGFKPE
jgi:hypothetical protein